MSRQRRGRPAAPAVPEIWWAVLHDEPVTAADRASLDFFMIDGLLTDEFEWHGQPAPRAVWRDYGEGIVASFAEHSPGRRPSFWWKFSSPRLQVGQLAGRGDDREDDRLPEPRRRLGGTGTPKFEVLNYVPTLSFGIPNCWIEAWEADYYGGKSGFTGDDPNSGPIFEGVPPDPADPPAFESQAAYLARHGLLLEGERERLSHSDFEPELLDVTPVAADDDTPMQGT
jgi:hypothetical protein